MPTVAMPTAKILVVDDEPAIRNLIHRFLLKQNYEMESAEDGKTALQTFDKFNPDLVILDVNLPDTTGFLLCKEMQKRTDVFVLMLTSLTGEHNIQRGFAQGADDYITKPFSLVELGARVGALLRRKRIVKAPEQPTLAVGNLKIDPVRREALLNEQEIVLTALEFDLLYFLANNPGRVWRRDELLHHVWNYDFVGDRRVVDVHIGQIRRKIEPDASHPSMIHTVRGVGYKFEPIKTSETGG